MSALCSIFTASKIDSPGAAVEVIVEADPEATDPKNNAESKPAKQQLSELADRARSVGAGLAIMPLAAVMAHFV